MTEPDEDVLVAFYQQQFNECYHLDTLDWRIALILVPAFSSFFAVIGFVSIFESPSIEMLENGVRAFSILVTLMALYGMWTVAQNQVWMNIRTSVIAEAERAMKVELLWQKVFRKSWWGVKTGRRIPLFLIYVYLVLAASSVAAAPSLKEWQIYQLLSQSSILITAALTAIVLIFQWIYYVRTKAKEDKKAED